MLPSGTNPQPHLLAVARAEAAELEHGVVIHLVVLQKRCDPGAVLRHHVLVGGEVARCQHDGLLANVLHVVAVGVLGDDGGNAPGVVVFADEVLADGAVVDLAALFLDLLLVHGDDEVLARGRARFLAVGLFHPVMRAGMRGEHALGVGVADLHRGGVALRFHEIDEPIHGGGAVVDPLVPLLLVHAIAVARQLLADIAVDRVLRVIGDAQTLVEFRPDAVVGAAARYRLGAGGEQDHVGAFFRCRCCAGQTRNACTHDDDVGLVGLRDLAVGHGLGRDLERPGSLVDGVGGQLPCGVGGGRCA